MKMINLVRIFILSSFFCFTLSYNPTAIIHGIMFNVSDIMTYLKLEIEKAQANSKVELIEILYETKSFYPMWVQVWQFQERLIQFMNDNPGPVNLIGYSQGGLIARAVLQVTPNHTVTNFISLASPQNGFHGELYVPKSPLYVGNEEKYSGSIAGFWKDPFDMTRYKKEGRFLATINNDYQHNLKTQFKTTICKLQQLVLISGPNDGVLVPWQSGHFGYDDARGRVTNMEQQQIYTNDNICLRNLNQRGAITRYTVPGVKHPDWHNNDTVIKNYILPHLS